MLAPMAPESRHLSEWIDRPADTVYQYASDPANLPDWAPGLGSSVEKVAGRWFVETPMGRAGFIFAPHNLAADLARLKQVMEGL
jgi:hypothetical protein